MIIFTILWLYWQVVEIEIRGVVVFMAPSDFRARSGGRPCNGPRHARIWRHRCPSWCSQLHLIPYCWGPDRLAWYPWRREGICSWPWLGVLFMLVETASHFSVIYHELHISQAKSVLYMCMSIHIIWGLVHPCTQAAGVNRTSLVLELYTMSNMRARLCVCDACVNDLSLAILLKFPHNSTN